MKVCDECGGKFGLVRHHYLRYSFCSRRCLERFKEDWLKRFRDEMYSRLRLAGEKGQSDH